jgi:hypothetical protein
MGNRGTAYIVLLKADGTGADAAAGAASYHVHPTSRAWGDVFPSCTCPDFAGRRVMCKHILFVLVKILHLSPPITRDVLDEACVHGPAPRLHAAARAPGAEARASAFPHLATPRRRPSTSFVRSDYQRADEVDLVAEALCQLSPWAACEAKPVEAGEDCAICFETMRQPAGRRGGGEALVFCAAQCGRHFHADCMERMARHSSAARVPLQCPLCRAPWCAVLPTVSCEGY